MVVINSFGVEINYETAVALMDDDLREKLHAEIAPCTNQEFFDSYCKAHEEKFSESFALDDPNPTY